ncbi:hypothetical protein D3C76_1531150 [compost metagenome]|jgi:hypothetical protein
MSSISSISNLNNWYLQSIKQVANTTQSTSKTTNKDSNSYLDDYQSSISSIQAAQNIQFSNPLSSLVTNGTINSCSGCF